MAQDGNEFHSSWDNIFIKVEDRLFCVPRNELAQSPGFANMFLSTSGPASVTRPAGQDQDHPVVLEGYKKDEFVCLLKVMYPTAKYLIPGNNLELQLKKEEWVNVLKLSTIWNMTKIRQCAIHSLSTNITLSPIEKIVLARAYRVGAWLHEAVTSLATTNDPIPTPEDLATMIGWETVGRIFWVRDDAWTKRWHSSMLHFKRDAIRCVYCMSSSRLIKSIEAKDYPCGHITSGDAELTLSSASTSSTKGNDVRGPLKQIKCQICGVNPFNFNSFYITCDYSSCGNVTTKEHNVRFTPHDSLKPMIEKMFGKEIKDYGGQPTT